MRKCFSGIAIFLTALVLVGLPAPPAAAQDSEQTQKTPYTIPEYNAFEAARAEKDAEARLKLLDAFVQRFPNSSLMQYVDQLYFQTYAELKNYPKTIEYADKLVELGDKVAVGARLQALRARVLLFPYVFNPKAADAQDQLTKERDAALEGSKLLQPLTKPADSNMTDAQFEEQKKPDLAIFDTGAGFADLQLKDYAAAAQAFKDALAVNPDDAVSNYRLGLAELDMNPPQTLDGFWALARSIDLKVPDGAKIKDYLHAKILAYEQPGCNSQVDAQLSELLQLAANAPVRPATYSIPSHDDLTKISQASNILTVISALQGGGDNAQMTWLAICGAEFPEVVGKIIDEQPGDGFVTFMVYTGATSDDMQAATTANMAVKVWTSQPPAAAAPATGQSPTTPAEQITPQPDVVRLQKDDGIRFSGTLASYDPSPFLLHWDGVKVDPTIIPEKTEPGKRREHHVPNK